MKLRLPYEALGYAKEHVYVEADILVYRPNEKCIRLPTGISGTY